MNKTAQDLQDKSLDFAVRIVRLARFLEDRDKDWILSRQILKCGTSIGANIREAQFAQSPADFVSKLSIALKEASETQYWLELLKATSILTDEQFTSLKADADWLVGTLVNVVKSSKRKLPSSISSRAAAI